MPEGTGAFDLEIALLAGATIMAAAAVGALVTRRLPIPLPVFLLAVGLLLGHDGLDVVRPEEISDLVRFVIVLSVALIVFEGGTVIRWRNLRTLATPVRRLVLLGLIVTPIVGAIAAHMFLDFGWRVSFLFGALVAVTGPSVITPLLRSVRVNDRLRAVFMAEGVIIDPFGALLTLFLLQLAIAPELDAGGPTAWVIERVVTGIVVGAAGAAFVWGLPRLVRRMSGREVSVVVVASAVTAFAVAEAIAHEAGLTAMVVMGIALGNLDFPQREAMHEFQESILAFPIAAVYVLLAASIDLEALGDLWPEGLYVVVALVLIGRPLLVVLSTFGSDISLREKAFLAAVAPRGVVAASLAGVVAVEAGGLVESQEQFIAMVFVVIAATIGIQSAYAGPLSRLLGVLPMTTVIAGSGMVGRSVARKLIDSGEQVVLVDNDEETVVGARELGLEVVLGDIGKADTLRKARLRDAQAFILATPSDDRNLLAAQLARSTFGVERIYARVNEQENLPAFQDLGVVVVNPAEAVADELTALITEPVLSELISPSDSDLSVVRVVVTNASAETRIQSATELQGTLVVLIRRGSQRMIPNGKTTLKLGDTVTMFGHEESVARARRFLTIGDA